MKYISSLLFLAAIAAVLTSCATGKSSAQVGDYKIISGKLGAAAQRWEIIKESAAGWEVVASAQDEEGSVLVLHKSK